MANAFEGPQDYWSFVANQAVWDTPWTQILDFSEAPLYKWFVGGKTNICYNLLDKHVKDGKGDKVAAICESAATRTSRVATFNELLQQVGRLAGALQNLNVTKGDLVFIYMPNILEVIVAILATWRIGGICLTLLPNTTAEALADRIHLSKPKIFITSNSTLLKNHPVYFKKPLDEALTKLNYQAKVIVYQRKEFAPAEFNAARDVDWEDALRAAAIVPHVPVDSNQIAIVSCSSGTTGKPKGIAFSTGGFLTSLSNKLVSKDDFYKDHSVTFSPSHPGWWSGIIGTIHPMMTSSHGIIYDGDATGNGDIDTIYRIVEKYKAESVIFNTATLRELRLADPDGLHAKKFDASSILNFFTGAEIIDSLTREWTVKHFGVTVIIGWGQTEGSYAAESLDNLQNQDLSYEDRHACIPGTGFSFKIFDEQGNGLPFGETGFIATKLPLPPSCAATLYLDDELYIKEYCSEFPGYFNTKDLGWMDKNGNLHIVGRGDDLMKVSGVSMTTIEAEDAILKDPDIAECAVVPLKHKEMYQVPIAFYIVKPGVVKVNAEILDLMKVHMEASFGPAVVFNYALRVHTLPTSNTGKINRKVIQTELQLLIKETSHYDDPKKTFNKLKEAATNLGML